MIQTPRTNHEKLTAYPPRYNSLTPKVTSIGDNLTLKFDKRYLIVLGALLVQSVTIGCMFAYGVFFSVLEAEFGWSRTLLSGGTAIGFLSMGILAIAAGRFNDLYGPRWVITITGACTGVAYMMLYFLSSPWQLFVIYGVLVGLGLAAHDVVTLSTVARNFPNRRGIMSGVVKVGAACGQMLVPVLAIALIAAVGWRSTFATMGVFALLLLMLAAWLIGLKPDTAPATVTSPESVRSEATVTGLTFTQARKTRQFWIFCAMQFFFFSCLTTIPTHIVSHGIDSEMSTAAAATLLSVIAASSIFGRLLIGFFVDKTGGRTAFVICLAGLCLSLVSLLFIIDPVHLYAFALIYGFTHGGLFTVVSPTLAEYFGMRAHGVIFGAIVFFGTLGGSVMPVITGLIFDVRGSYVLAFTVMATMAGISLVLAIVLGSPAGIVQANSIDESKVTV